MEIRIRNIYDSDVVKFKANYIAFHAGIEVAWVHIDNDVTTIMLFDKQYKVSLNEDTIHVDIKRR